MAKPALVLERILPARPEVVFEHWSDAESLALWMRPEESMGNATVEVDFRIGGAFEIVMHGDQHFRQHGEFLEIEQNRRLVLRWVSDWMPPGERETKLTITFEAADGNATHLVLTHEALPESDAYDGHVAGWTLILTRLTQEIEKSIKREGGPP